MVPGNSVLSGVWALVPESSFSSGGWGLGPSDFRITQWVEPGSQGFTDGWGLRPRYLKDFSCGGGSLGVWDFCLLWHRAQRFPCYLVGAPWLLGIWWIFQGIEPTSLRFEGLSGVWVLGPWWGLGANWTTTRRLVYIYLFWPRVADCTLMLEIRRNQFSVKTKT